MSVRFRCGECDYSIKVASKFAGKRGKCPSCKAVVRVPRARAEVACAIGGPAARRAAPPARRAVAVIALPSGGGEVLDAYRDCPMCAERIRSKATKCRHCGEHLDRHAETAAPAGSAPGHVDLIFQVCGFVIAGLGILAGLNAAFGVVVGGGRAVIPGLITGVIAYCVVRIGLGLREKNRLCWVLAALLGGFVLLVNGLMTLAVLDGASVYLVPGMRLSSPGVLLSMVFNLAAYVPPVVFGIRYWRDVEWT